VEPVLGLHRQELDQGPRSGALPGRLGNRLPVSLCPEPSKQPQPQGWATPVIVSPHILPA
jgi:hypothetical protein